MNHPSPTVSGRPGGIIEFWATARVAPTVMARLWAGDMKNHVNMIWYDPKIVRGASIMFLVDLARGLLRIISTTVTTARGLEE